MVSAKVQEEHSGEPVQFVKVFKVVCQAGLMASCPLAWYANR